MSTTRPMEQPIIRSTGPRTGQTRTPYLYAILGCLLLGWFLVYNGWPIFYEDTSAYLTRPGRVLGSLGLQSEWNPLEATPGGSAASGAEGKTANFRSVADNPVWLAGRSVYYGTLMVLLATLTTSFGIALVQGYLCALAIAVPWFRLGGRAVGYVAVMALLSALTGVSVIAATLTPDIFLPIAILVGATLIVLWRDLARFDRVVLTLLLCFAAIAHDSILALLLSASILCAFALLFVRGRAMASRFAPIWLASLAGVCGMLGFALAAESASGRPPLNLPHLTARTATSAEGRSVLRELCPRLDLAVCRYQDQVKRGDWIDFMFSDDAATGVFARAPLETKYALADEQFELLFLVARKRPLGFAERQADDVLRQLASFSLIDFDVSKKPALAGMLPVDMLAKVRATQSQRDGGRVIAVLSGLTAASTLAGLAFIIVCLGYRWYRRKPTEAEVLALLLLFGVLLNAVICATLAGVYDRFQARVVWLVPLAAAFLIRTMRDEVARRRLERLGSKG